MRLTGSKWFLPSVTLGFGVVVFAAEWVGGDFDGGLESLGIAGVFGALILLGGRSETIRGLRGDGRDERFRKIDIHATAVAGCAMLLGTIVASIVELARGRTPGPYGWLAATGGIAYIAAVVIFRVRG